MRRSLICCFGVLLGHMLINPALADGGLSQFTIGPQAVQALIAQQLFNHSGRWYLQDQGPCYAYLESPHTHLTAGRLVLDAHLSSRLGLSAGGNCLGAGFASNVTLSTAIRAHGSEIVFDDIRIDHIEDSTTATAIDLLRQTAPTAIPSALKLDLGTLIRGGSTNVAGFAVSLDRLKIQEIVTSPSGIAVTFSLFLSSP
jgi:hypothetical protein